MTQFSILALLHVNKGWHDPLKVHNFQINRIVLQDLTHRNQPRKGGGAHPRAITDIIPNAKLTEF